jgi:phage terminase large subunit GpA-like protein
MASAQVGKTESFINNPIGYFIHQEPSPMLIVNPTLKMSETWSKDRFAPMLKDTPVLNGLVKEARSKDSDNTILHKTFPGGHITMAGANSAPSLAARPVRIVALDDVDRFPPSAGSEGDPVNLAIKRTTTFWNRKKLLASTPTTKGASRIEAAYEESDQRKFYVPCPHCEEFQILEFKFLNWEKEIPKGGKIEKHLTETAHFVCRFCDGVMEESDRPRMLTLGKWIAAKPFKGIAGFWINELYSPWVPWATFVENFLEAKKLPETLKVFTNTSLAETWEEKGKTLDDDFLLSRREDYGPNVAPEGVLVITAAVDVQDDRLELAFQGWGVDEETWGLGYEKISGDPSDWKTWDALDTWLEKSFLHPSGVELRVLCTTVDSGGHHTQMVYEYCQKKQIAQARVFPIKGYSDRGKPLVSKISKNNKLKVGLYMLGVDTGKELAYGRFQVAEPGPGYCHFPLDYDEDYFRGLTAEHRVRRFSKGAAYYIWTMKQGYRRNEPLDLFVYNMAALKILNVNLKSISENWESWKATVTNTATPARKRRIISKGIK